MDTIERAELREKVANCHSIAWDTCHKIYVLMDEKKTKEMKGYGYEAIIEASHSTPNLMYSTVLHWYRNSCALKFVDAISSGEDGEGVFDGVVSQR